MHDNQIAWFWLKQADYARTGADTDDSEGLIDHIRAIQGVVVAVFFEELPEGKVRVSMRSKNNRVDVSAICQKFGGGGHKNAAGCTAIGPIDALKALFVEKISGVSGWTGS